MKVVKIGNEQFYAANKNNADENLWLSKYSGIFIKLNNGTEYRIPLINSKRAKGDDSTSICLCEKNGVKYYPVKFGGTKYAGSQNIETTTSSVSFGGHYAHFEDLKLILQEGFFEKSLSGKIAYAAECSLADGVTVSFTIWSAYQNESNGNLVKSGNLSSSFSGKTNCKPFWEGQVTNYLKVWVAWRYNGKIIASDYCHFKAFFYIVIPPFNFYYDWYETFKYTQKIVREKYISIAPDGSLKYTYKDRVSGEVSKEYHEGSLIKGHYVPPENREFL